MIFSSVNNIIMNLVLCDFLKSARLRIFVAYMKFKYVFMKRFLLIAVGLLSEFPKQFCICALFAKDFCGLKEPLIAVKFTPSILDARNR